MVMAIFTNHGWSYKNILNWYAAYSSASEIIESKTPAESYALTDFNPSRLNA
jgi:hypothetical protein